MRAGIVVRLQVLVVEARALAELAVPGLELARGFHVGDDGIGAGADLLHLLEVGGLERGNHDGGVAGVQWQRRRPRPASPGDLGPTVHDSLYVGSPPGRGRRDALQTAL